MPGSDYRWTAPSLLNTTIPIGGRVSDNEKGRKRTVDDIGRRIRAMKDCALETDLLFDRSLHEADILITDRSGIAFEYAFGTERPVLFINTPPKISNPEFRKLGIEPVENKLRDAIGLSVELSDIGTLEAKVRRLLDERGAYAERIRSLRDEYVFNWMGSARAGADYIIASCKARGGHA